MAKHRMLHLVKEGVPDERLWHWTPELAKDPNMREVYVEKGKWQSVLVVKEEIADTPTIVYSARPSGFGEFDIIKTIPAEADGDEPVDEIIDHITGIEAAKARVEELNYPQGRSDIPSPAPEQKEMSAEERISAIEDAISSMDEADWGKGPLPYPKVPAVPAITGFKVSFQEIKAVWDNMKPAPAAPEDKEEA